MPRFARTSSTPRRTRTRLLTAGTVAALACVPAVVAASAGPASDDAVPTRTVALQPTDRISPVVADADDELLTVLAGAIQARSELTAVEPEPENDPEPERDPEPQGEPEPESEPEPVEPAGVDAGVWDRVAECESGGNWQIDTGNSFYGGLQFTIDSWNWVGGSGMPHEASKAEQIRRAEILLDRQGWVAWPACSEQLGLR